MPAKSPLSHPTIAPLAAEAERSFWSVMIPAYKRIDYLERTLRSVLEQAPDEAQMQIEVVDNASPGDEIEQLVRRVGQGRVQYFRHETNLGMACNWNSCIQRARGEWIHILHDDDMVLSNFYHRFERLIEKYPNAAILSGPAILVDENDNVVQAPQQPLRDGSNESDGVMKNFLARQACENLLLTPTVVVARRVYEKQGGFSPDLQHTADWEMWFRAALCGDAIASEQPVAFYRLHAGAATANDVRTGRNMKDGFSTVNACYARLPVAIQQQIKNTKYRPLAQSASSLSVSLAHNGDFESSLRQASWALRLWPGRTAFKVWLHALMRMLMRGKTSARRS